MKSQRKSKLIADLLASQHRLRKGAVAQISLVHQVTSRSPDAADATRKMNMRSRSPRVFCCFAFAESCCYGETPLLSWFCPSVCASEWLNLVNKQTTNTHKILAFQSIPMFIYTLLANICPFPSLYPQPLHCYQSFLVRLFPYTLGSQTNSVFCCSPPEYQDIKGKPQRWYKYQISNNKQEQNLSYRSFHREAQEQNNTMCFLPPFTFPGFVSRVIFAVLNWGTGAPSALVISTALRAENSKAGDHTPLRHWGCGTRQGLLS